MFIPIIHVKYHSVIKVLTIWMCVCTFINLAFEITVVTYGIIFTNYHIRAKNERAITQNETATVIGFLPDTLYDYIEHLTFSNIHV